MNDQLKKQGLIKNETIIELEMLSEAAKTRSDIYKEEAAGLRKRVSHLETIIISLISIIVATLFSLLVKFFSFGN